VISYSVKGFGNVESSYTNTFMSLQKLGGGVEKVSATVVDPVRKKANWSLNK